MRQFAKYVTLLFIPYEIKIMRIMAIKSRLLLASMMVVVFYPVVVTAADIKRNFVSLPAPRQGGSEYSNFATDVKCDVNIDGEIIDGDARKLILTLGLASNDYAEPGTT